MFRRSKQRVTPRASARRIWWRTALGFLQDHQDGEHQACPLPRLVGGASARLSQPSASQWFRRTYRCYTLVTCGAPMRQMAAGRLVLLQLADLDVVCCTFEKRIDRSAKPRTLAKSTGWALFLTSNYGGGIHSIRTGRVRVALCFHWLRRDDVCRTSLVNLAFCGCLLSHIPTGLAFSCRTLLSFRQPLGCHTSIYLAFGCLTINYGS